MALHYAATLTGDGVGMASNLPKFVQTLPCASTTRMRAAPIG
jgi:hypothetical protein